MGIINAAINVFNEFWSVECVKFYIWTRDIIKLLLHITQNDGGYWLHRLLGINVH